MAEAIVAAAALAALVPAALRWLRVAQREHYIAGSASRFAYRWWVSSSMNAGLLVVGLVGLGAAPFWPLAGLAPVLVAAVGPVGLTIRGRTGKLAWTDRLRRLAVLLALVLGLTGGLGLALGSPGLVLAGFTLLLPIAVDLALTIARPLETALARPWLNKARSTLDRVDPIRVAITGSYGKTTTKEYVRTLLSVTTAAVASPASFNNAMGLARAVNEHLAPGTEVFVAEMGTYGPGEIAELVAWVKPQVSVITAIGPVHLERFGSEENIVTAKAEILEGAEWAVLNVDDHRLAALADATEQAGTRVVRCSADDPAADVSFAPGEGGHTLNVGGEAVATVEALPTFPGNAACAVGVALALDVPLDGAGAALAAMVRPAHRQTLSRSDLGFTIVDDTYNSNPAGARAALEELACQGGPDSRRVVATPGMVELGRKQVEENVAFGAAAATAVDDVIVIGRTNRKALLAGAAAGSAAVTTVGDRTAAVAWVRRNLGPGDAVLYENDLPDHYP